MVLLLQLLVELVKGSEKSSFVERDASEGRKYGIWWAEHGKSGDDALLVDGAFEDFIPHSFCSSEKSYRQPVRVRGPQSRG